ncbi:helix-turn-helix domain-containing protein [Christiangramia echinicola]|uniref:Helix-turn-helix domain-containing protein n=1 Tax=Christiangramia echinicola TaxID=279359 RepID=A0A1H1REY3_9FLAO|nr:helix-turn-helix domain-containing protein [Christiangramia echinicola]SDS34242.1 Helix-turn-helix domain-containing protein [Christiangramia echinicola]
MPTSIVTTDDLMEFKLELLEEIQKLLEKKSGNISEKWLKSTEVMKMLKISAGTLYGFRTKGILPYSKIGGLIYYDLAIIKKTLTDNLIQNE